MSNIAALDFMPEGSPVVQIIPTAKREDVLNEAYRRLAMLADSLIIMGENETLLSMAPQYASLFMSWATLAHEAGVMVRFANGANSANTSGGDHE